MEAALEEEKAKAKRRVLPKVRSFGRPEAIQMVPLAAPRSAGAARTVAAPRAVCATRASLASLTSAPQRSVSLRPAATRQCRRASAASD